MIDPAQDYQPGPHSGDVCPVRAMRRAEARPDQGLLDTGLRRREEYSRAALMATGPSVPVPWVLRVR